MQFSGKQLEEILRKQTTPVEVVDYSGRVRLSTSGVEVATGLILTGYVGVGKNSRIRYVKPEGVRYRPERFGCERQIKADLRESAVTTPISLDNLWRRNMRPVLEAIGMEWATFQVLRKTNASLSKKAGVDPKVASDQRGHGLGVSLEVYTSSDLEQKRAALKKLEAAVLRKPQQPSELAKSA